MTMRRLSLSVLSLCGVLLLPSSASGQKTYALGFGGGAAIPVGKLSDTQKTGYNGIVLLAVGAAELPIGIRFDAMYNNILSASQVIPAQGGGAAPSVDLRVMSALANLVFAFPGTNAKVYVVAGGGLYNSKPDVSGAKSQNNLGFNGGLGTTFGTGPFAMFIEARYHSVSRSAAKGGVYQFVPVTLGLLF
jgi:hypothetical protein